MSIILSNYHSRSSVVRDDEAIKTLAETEEIWAKIRICRVAKTSEIRKQSVFLAPHIAVAVLVCLSSLLCNSIQLHPQNIPTMIATIQTNWIKFVFRWGYITLQRNNIPPFSASSNGFPSRSNLFLNMLWSTSVWKPSSRGLKDQNIALTHQQGSTRWPICSQIWPTS